MTNPNDPNDLIAIKIGQLFLRAEEQKKAQLSVGIDEIKLFEEEQALKELQELEKAVQDHLEETRRQEEEARRQEEEARESAERSKSMQRKLMQRKDEFNKRFRSQ